MTLDTTHRGRIPCAVMLAVTAMFGSVTAQQGFQHVLPEDTLVFIGVDDSTAYAHDWSVSSLGMFYSSERMRPSPSPCMR